MLRFTLTAWLGFSCLVGIGGCNQPLTTPVAVRSMTKVAAPVSKEPSVIELSAPRVYLGKSNLVHFEVAYRFTHGKPTKYYCCEIRFPETKNCGVKNMDAWELQESGIIKDGIVLTDPPVTKFELRILEATSPQYGYDLISNVATGVVAEPASDP